MVKLIRPNERVFQSQTRFGPEAPILAESQAKMQAAEREISQGGQQIGALSAIAQVKSRIARANQEDRDSVKRARARRNQFKADQAKRQQLFELETQQAENEAQASLLDSQAKKRLAQIFDEESNARVDKFGNPQHSTLATRLRNNGRKALQSIANDVKDPIVKEKFLAKADLYLDALETNSISVARRQKVEYTENALREAADNYAEAAINEEGLPLNTTINQFEDMANNARTTGVGEDTVSEISEAFKSQLALGKLERIIRTDIGEAAEILKSNSHEALGIKEEDYEKIKGQALEMLGDVQRNIATNIELKINRDDELTPQDFETLVKNVTPKEEIRLRKAYTEKVKKDFENKEAEKILVEKLNNNVPLSVQDEKAAQRKYLKETKNLNTLTEKAAVAIKYPGVVNEEFSKEIANVIQNSTNPERMKDVIRSYKLTMQSKSDVLALDDTEVFFMESIIADQESGEILSESIEANRLAYIQPVEPTLRALRENQFSAIDNNLRSDGDGADPFSDYIVGKLDGWITSPDIDPDALERLYTVKRKVFLATGSEAKADNMIARMIKQVGQNQPGFTQVGVTNVGDRNIITRFPLESTTKLDTDEIDTRLNTILSSPEIKGITQVPLTSEDVILRPKNKGVRFRVDTDEEGNPMRDKKGNIISRKDFVYEVIIDEGEDGEFPLMKRDEFGNYSKVEISSIDIVETK